jgi:uncharacterized protein (TIGR04255 family)
MPEPLPKFDNPPVSEVAFGFQFAAAPVLSTVSIGMYCNSIKDRYPIIAEQVPLPDIPEPGLQLMFPRFEFASGLPPVRRVWMQTEDHDWLVQIQENRFHVNWRRVSGRKYPSFEMVSERFRAEWSHFLEWTKAAKIAVLPQRYELTYINLITSENGFSANGRAHELLSFFSPINGRLLSNPVLMTGDLGFELPDDKGILSVSVKHVIQKSNNQPGLQIELTARGICDPERFESAFKTAHEYIVIGFADLITDRAKEMWKMKK